MNSIKRSDNKVGDIVLRTFKFSLKEDFIEIKDMTLEGKAINCHSSNSPVPEEKDVYKGSSEGLKSSGLLNLPVSLYPGPGIKVNQFFSRVYSWFKTEAPQHPDFESYFSYQLLDHYYDYSDEAKENPSHLSIRIHFKTP